MVHFFRTIHSRLTLLVGVTAAMLCTLLNGLAALPLDPPESFFTNVADRLLQQQLGMRLGEVQIAPLWSAILSRRITAVMSRIAGWCAINFIA